MVKILCMIAQPPGGPPWTQSKNLIQRACSLSHILPTGRIPRKIVRWLCVALGIVLHQFVRLNRYRKGLKTPSVLLSTPPRSCAKFSSNLFSSNFLRPILLGQVRLDQVRIGNGLDENRLDEKWPRYSHNISLAGAQARYSAVGRALMPHYRANVTR